LTCFWTIRSPLAVALAILAPAAEPIERSAACADAFSQTGRRETKGELRGQDDRERQSVSSRIVAPVRFR
jgi:hypothetical protein